MIIPTPRLCILVVLGILIAVGGALIHGLEQFVLPYNLGLLIISLTTAFFLPRSRDLKVTRNHDSVLSVRAQNRIELILENEGNIACSGLLRESTPDGFESSVQDFKFHLEGKRIQTMQYHLTPKSRGEYEFGDVHIRLNAPLGLVCIQRIIPAVETFHVYPNILALKEFDLLKQRGRLNLMGIRKAKIRGQGTEFESLREYDSDDYRKIDWKSTARKGKLVVRDFETERNQSVIVCVDTGRNMATEVDGVSKLDLVLDACLMLMHAASTGGDQTGFLVFNDRVQKFIPPRKGRAHNGAIVNAVHAIEPEFVESNYNDAFAYLGSRWKRRSLIVIFTDADDKASAQLIASATSHLCRRHIVLLARVKDPKVTALQNAPVEDVMDVYHRAAALWYGSERRRAEMTLAAAGLQNIDAEPEELAQALVSAYLRVKETAAL